MMLLLKRTVIGGDTVPDDYIAFKDDKPVGRIMLHPQAPAGQPWFWTITAREKMPSIYNRGYRATREEAMANFKTRWFDPTTDCVAQ